MELTEAQQECETHGETLHCLPQTLTAVFPTAVCQCADLALTEARRGQDSQLQV